MRYVKSAFPPGTVIVPTSGMPRFQQFQESFERLHVPENTRRALMVGSDMTRSLNKATDEMTGEWAFYIGDDHTFDPNILLRLLGHNLPIVVSLNISRFPPFGPTLLRGEMATAQQIDWSEVPAHDQLWTLPADIHTGNNGMLVRKDVLDRIEKPVWRCGQINPGRLNEDFYFWESVRKLGIPVIVDLGAPMWHANSFEVLPMLKDGKWSVGLACYGKVFMVKQ